MPWRSPYDQERFQPWRSLTTYMLQSSKKAKPSTLHYFIKLIFLLVFIIGFYFSFKYVQSYIDELKLRQLEDAISLEAKSIADKMTLDELSGQVIHISLPDKKIDNISRKEIRKIQPGGIILFGKNLGTKNEISTFTNDLQSIAFENHIPSLIISADQESGRVIRVTDGVTQFPGAMALGQTKNSEYARLTGFITSYELSLLGINTFFAPVLDINNNPDNPVINTRSFGSDVKTVTEMGVAFEGGARAGGSIPVIKHFPGHGDTDTDSHLGLPIINKNLSELEKFELIPFAQAIASGAEAVMTAHIVYPNIDKYFPSTLSKIILTDFLRDKLGYKGIVFTDAMEMHAISKNYYKDKPSVLAILAGANIILFTSWGKEPVTAKKQIIAAYKNGDFQRGKKDILKEAVISQLKLKIKTGIILSQLMAEKLKNTKIANLKEYTKMQHELPNLNHEISMSSIKSFKKDFQKIDKKDKIGFKFRNGILLEELNSMKLKQIKNIKEADYYIIDTFDEKDISRINNILGQYPNIKLIVLHYGNPFLNFPENNNLNILFSFSPTRESLIALLQSVFASENSDKISKADLIFPNINTVK